MFEMLKVYIIRCAEIMSEEAQNCLLKTIEEPPEYAVVILTTANPMILRETIRSRVSRIDFGRYSYDEMQEILISKGYNENVKNNFLISASDGIPGKAINLASSNDYFVYRDKIIDYINGIKKSSDGYVELYNYFEKEKAAFEDILEIMETYFRDVLLLNSGAEVTLLLNADKKDIIIRDASSWSKAALINCIGHIESCRKALQQNANFSNAVQVLALNIQEEYKR